MPQQKNFDEKTMGECFRLARKGMGRVSPNPLVGAVLVRKGRIIARGYHKAFGAPHAEVECLRRAKGPLRDATLYVNLEPCCHYGKTPPCTQLILDSGVGEVVVAMKDPNPLVAGKGITQLRRNGVKVRVGIGASEALLLNEMFSTHIQYHRPYIHLKVAQSLDGKIAPPEKQRVQISSASAQRIVHLWRANHDAVLIGAGTVKHDNPRLDARLVKGRNPAIVVVDGNLSSPMEAQLWKQAMSRQVFLCTSRSAVTRRQRQVNRLRLLGVVVLAFEVKTMTIPLSLILKELYHHNVGSVLVEGGAGVFSQFMMDGFVDRLSVFIAPYVMGAGIPPFSEMRGPTRLVRKASSMTWTTAGQDMLFSARFQPGR